MVLGGGRVGNAIVRDLAAEEDFSVLVVDVDPVAVERLTEHGADGVVADLSDPETVSQAVADADLVVSAVPGFMGYSTVERVLQEGHPSSGYLLLPRRRVRPGRAREGGRRPVPRGLWVAPGLSNMVLGRLEEHLDETYSYHCLVGGLPVEREWPWEYKAPFSPGDVIQIYTRSARLRRHGVEITLPALSEVELVEFPGLGTLEAFNTDGLRSLLRTCKTPEMVTKTMRYPGHAEKIRMLREAGFFSTENVLVASGQARPRDVTETLLIGAWHFDEGEPDLTVMRLEIEGAKDDHALRHTYNLLDYYNTDTETSSMARTTGYTCTGMARFVARGLWTEPGVASPEVVGRSAECFDSVIKHLEDRNVQIFQRLDEL